MVLIILFPIYIFCIWTGCEFRCFYSISRDCTHAKLDILNNVDLYILVIRVYKQHQEPILTITRNQVENIPCRSVIISLFIYLFTGCIKNIPYRSAIISFFIYLFTGCLKNIPYRSAIISLSLFIYLQGVLKTFPAGQSSSLYLRWVLKQIP